MSRENRKKAKTLSGKEARMQLRKFQEREKRAVFLVKAADAEENGRKMHGASESQLSFDASPSAVVFPFTY